MITKKKKKPSVIDYNELNVAIEEIAKEVSIDSEIIKEKVAEAICQELDKFYQKPFSVVYGNEIVITHQDNEKEVIFDMDDVTGVLLQKIKFCFRRILSRFRFIKVQEKIKERIGQLESFSVIHYSNNTVNVEIFGKRFYLPRKNFPHHEKLSVGSRIMMLIQDIQEKDDHVQLYATRRGTNFVNEVAKFYIPEIMDNKIKMLKTIRFHSRETAFVLYSDAREFIKYCIGANKCRIQAIRNEVGERIQFIDTTKPLMSVLVKIVKSIFPMFSFVFKIDDNIASESAYYLVNHAESVCYDRQVDFENNRKYVVQVFIDASDENLLNKKKLWSRVCSIECAYGVRIEPIYIFREDRERLKTAMKKIFGDFLSEEKLDVFCKNMGAVRDLYKITSSFMAVNCTFLQEEIFSYFSVLSDCCDESEQFVNKVCQEDISVEQAFEKMDHKAY